MATHASITLDRNVPPALGTTPFLPVSVERRPASFADAVQQYRRSLAAADAADRVMRQRSTAPGPLEDHFSRRVEELVDVADRLLHVPALTIADLAHKLRVLADNGDWSEHAGLVIADAERLAVRA